MSDMARLAAWWAGLLVAGTAVGYVGVETFEPGPVPALVVGMLWGWVCPYVVLTIVDR